MTKRIQLDEPTRATLERMCEEYGMQTVAEHTGLTTRVISSAVKQDSHGITEADAAAIREYLKGRV